LDAAARARIEALAQAMGYETECAFGTVEMAEAMLADKKAAGGFVDFVLPLAVGRCAVTPVASEHAAVMAGGDE
jgi:3-dehydroquinate synthetase